MTETATDQLDALTKQNIAQSLWMKEYDESKIPADILAKIRSEKNSNAAFGSRYKARLQQLISNQLSFVPSRIDRYQALLQYTGSRSPQQCYTSNLFLGPESVTGYTKLSLNPAFPFPQTDAPQWDIQVGWHFFVGNFTDAAGKHYSVELMFWQYAQLPPPLAASLGLSDIENQTLEMHLAICDPQTGTQYRATTSVVAGTTGLINFTAAPYTYSMGKNTIQGSDPSGKLFPVRLTCLGWDMGKTPNAEISIDISLEDAKGYFMEGDGGCSPSIDGIGTYYYSASLLKLKAGSTNTITINGNKITLTDGRMWYDHQWGTGFMPSGAPEHAVLRASQNLSPAAPGGWDWFMFQFHPNIVPEGEVQMTVSALHTHELAETNKFYWQTGPVPPPMMEAVFKGKYINAANVTAEISGTMTVTAWVKNTSSPNPAVYPPTNTWYPAKYHFVMDKGSTVPATLTEFDVTPLIPSGQTGFFGNGLQYTEGGAVITNIAGVEIGRGFAEGTNWADSKAGVVTLAGLPVNAQTLGFLKAPQVNWFLKLLSTIEVLFNKATLTKILKEARGL